MISLSFIEKDILPDGEENQNKSMEFEIPNKTTNDFNNDNGKPRIINCPFYNHVKTAILMVNSGNWRKK